MIEGLCCTFTYPNMVKFEQNLDYSNKFMGDAKAIKDVQHKHKTAKLLTVIIVGYHLWMWNPLIFSTT